jgi:hypothetical protein
VKNLDETICHLCGKSVDTENEDFTLHEGNTKKEDRWYHSSCLYIEQKQIEWVHLVVDRIFKI